MLRLGGMRLGGLLRAAGWRRAAGQADRTGPAHRPSSAVIFSGGDCAARAMRRLSALPAGDAPQAAPHGKRKDDLAWKETLTEAEFYVLREKGTEPPGSGRLNKFFPQVVRPASFRRLSTSSFLLLFTQCEVRVFTPSGRRDRLTFFCVQDGHFACAGCGTPLYSASSKFDSGCGWPAFDKCYLGNVKVQHLPTCGFVRRGSHPKRSDVSGIREQTEVDNTWGMRRVEILCSSCDGHLGHVFGAAAFASFSDGAIPRASDA